MIRYLWKNREKPKFLSFRWFKVWVKRSYHFYGLLQLLLNRFSLSSAGAQVGDLSVVGKMKIDGPAKNITISERTFISGKAYIACHDLVCVGSNVVINDYVTILTASHDINHPAWPMYKKAVCIDDWVWIATGATILPGVSIGRGAVIGARAVVRKNVEPYSVVVGNPAATIGVRHCQHYSYNPVGGCAVIEAWLGSPTK